jgi:aryl-alcohol dehydrogenase-like predicted oxidoreductase
MTALPLRRLGTSDLSVSLFSLGSWRTFERIPREQGLAVMRAARDAGITFLDDARYDDETGSAPIATGYSEVVFGDLFRAAGWVRDEVVVANKLWWELWPAQDAASELDGSLGRMGLDHVDLIYAMQPPEGLAVEELVAQVASLVSSGRARAWGIGNWRADTLAAAVAAARAQGVPLPAAAQLPYSLVRADWVDDPAMDAVLRDAGIPLVASYVLAGGTLTGKYLDASADLGGRAAADESAPIVAGKQRAAALVALAREWGVTPASLAFSFALDHPRLASVLFGATSPDQLRENVASLAVHDALDGEQRARLRSLATS